MGTLSPDTYTLITEENDMILGWRKLGAWFLVFALVAALSWKGIEIKAINADLIKWVTGFFFGANALKALFERVPVAEALEKLKK